MPRFNYGGQALIEGVMMRGRDAIAVALRHPDGRIVFATERLDSGFHGNRAVASAVRARARRPVRDPHRRHPLARSASAGLQAEDEGVELGKGSVALMLGITAVVGIGLFFILPLVVATLTAGNIENDLVQHFVEGLVRVVHLPRLPRAHQRARRTSRACSSTTAPST